MFYKHFTVKYVIIDIVLPCSGVNAGGGGGLLGHAGLAVLNSKQQYYRGTNKVQR